MKTKTKTLTREEAWGWQESVPVCAFRYALGRQTYIVGVVADWIIANWSTFNPNTRALIQTELEENFERDDNARFRLDAYKPLGWDCNRKEWERVRNLWSIDNV